MANLKMAHKNFVDSLKAEGKSESTLVAYNKDIEQIIEFIAKQGVTEVDGMDIKHLEGFMKDLNSKGYTPKSISRKTNAARTFSVGKLLALIISSMCMGLLSILL